MYFWHEKTDKQNVRSVELSTKPKKVEDYESN